MKPFNKVDMFEEAIRDRAIKSSYEFYTALCSLRFSFTRDYANINVCTQNEEK